MRDIPSITGGGTARIHGTLKDGILVYSTDNTAIYLPPSSFKQISTQLGGQTIPILANGSGKGLDDWLHSLGLIRALAMEVAAVLVEQGLAQHDGQMNLIFPAGFTPG